MSSTSSSKAASKLKPIVTKSGETKLVPIHHPGDQTGNKRGNGYVKKDQKIVAMRAQLVQDGLKPSPVDGKLYCLDCPDKDGMKNYFTAYRHMLNHCKHRFERFPQLRAMEATQGNAASASGVAANGTSANDVSAEESEGEDEYEDFSPAPSTKKRTRRSAFKSEGAAPARTENKFRKIAAPVPKKSANETKKAILPVWETPIIERSAGPNALYYKGAGVDVPQTAYNNVEVTLQSSETTIEGTTGPNTLQFGNADIEAIDYFIENANFDNDGPASASDNRNEDLTFALALQAEIERLSGYPEPAAEANGFNSPYFY